LRIKQKFDILIRKLQQNHEENESLPIAGSKSMSEVSTCTACRVSERLAQIDGQMTAIK